MAVDEIDKEYNKIQPEILGNLKIQVVVNFAQNFPNLRLPESVKISNMISQKPAPFTKKYKINKAKVIK